MQTPNSAIEYAYTADLNKNQWAWEFLRRNSAYKLDYHWFITQWQALEKDYGRSPDMDYQAWKQDPRSYKIIDISSEQDGNCAISDDRLLIECWMGNKWGFYQFPQSPELTAAEIDITWRSLPPEYQAPLNPAEIIKSDLLQQIEFDLTKPLKEQLEQTKHQLIITQRQLKKQGRLMPYTIAGKKGLWQSCLQYLDNSMGEKYVDRPNSLDEREVNQQISVMADYYLQHYLSILSLMEK